MFRSACLLVALALTFAVVGCGRPKEETIKVGEPTDPLQDVKNILDRYAKGNPMGSEVTSFQYHVNTIRKIDPAKGDILEKGFADIEKEKNSANRAAKAKQILSKL